MHFPGSPQVSLHNKFDIGQNELISKYFLFGSIISPVGKDVICPLRF